MTARAIGGLVGLNAAYAVTGLALLWSMRGFPRWADVLRLAGLGYLLGVAAFGTVWTELLVVGVRLDGWRIVLTLSGLTAAACVAGALLRRSRPSRRARTGGVPVSTAAMLVTATGVALTGLLLEALFRSARLQSLQAYDAWAFWVPKAMAIYFFGGLDVQVFTTAPGPTYPPLVPILDAAAFHAMGSADVITFHLQFWFLALGGVAAIAGCLYHHAPAWLLWPPLVLVIAAPRFGGYLLVPQADVLVDVLFVVGALLMALWVVDGHGWRLAAAAVLFCGAALTKREGLLFAAAALSIAAVASIVRHRRAWPALLLMAATVAAAALPWRLWYRHHGLGGEAPSNAGVGGSLDRALDSLRLSLDVLFDSALWSVLPVVALIAVGAALVWGDRRVATFFGGLLVLIFLGGAWVTYSYRDIPVTADESVNPIVRYTGAIVLLAAAGLPLLLASVWRGRAEEPG